MPLAQFICPDGQEVDVGQCLSQCRMAQRCLTLPTLIKIATSERPWDGHPSTTRLMNGTMLEYLRATIPYSIDPKSRSFALLGNDHHEKLAAASVGGAAVLAEVRQKDALVPGTPDVLEVDESIPGYHILTDYKTYGSYRVAKMLGIEKIQTISQTEVYKSSGKWGKAGTPKKITGFKIVPALGNTKDEQLQLNHYRVLLEAQGYPISKIQVQVTVRDGGLQAAMTRGVMDTIYLINIPMMTNYAVESYFERKRLLLVQAMDQKVIPQACNEDESWGGHRCQSYCEVAKHCIKGQVELLKKAQKERTGPQTIVG